MEKSKVMESRLRREPGKLKTRCKLGSKRLPDNDIHSQSEADGDAGRDRVSGPSAPSNVPGVDVVGDVAHQV